MKYNVTFRVLGLLLDRIVKKELPDKTMRRSVQKTYRDIVHRASDIGSRNTLLGAYGLAACLIALNRCDGLTPEENCTILENGLRNSRVYRMTMGSADSYFSQKRMEARRKWSRETHEKKYPNDWIVDIIEQGDDFEFGFDYHACGVCKLCQDEGCPEYAKYLCRLDYMTSEMMGIRLKRTMTLAEGFDKCDFRFSRK